MSSRENRPARVMKENSFVARVVAAVKKRGAATIDDLQADFPDTPRKTLHDALANGRDARQLRVKVRGHFNSRSVSVWEVGTHHPRVGKEPPPPRPLPSVWALGSPPQWDQWPPKFQNGRRYTPLGPWTEEATNDNHRSAAA